MNAESFFKCRGGESAEEIYDKNPELIEQVTRMSPGKYAIQSLLSYNTDESECIDNLI